MVKGMDMSNSMQWDNKINFDFFLNFYKKEHQRALEKLAFVILGDVLNKEPRPPILTSALWGSGSVFVGNKVIAFGRQVSAANTGTPNTDISENDENMVTVGFNVIYAEKMHENEFNWGPRSRQAGGVGSKYIERKIVGNAAQYLIEYAILIKSGMGL
jgi:hypothetical protein